MMFGNEENVLHNVIVIYLTFILQLSHAILSLKSRFIELIMSGKLNCVSSYIQFVVLSEITGPFTMSVPKCLCYCGIRT